MVDDVSDRSPVAGDFWKKILKIYFYIRAGKKSLFFNMLL